MYPEFEKARLSILVAQLEIEKALAAARATIPMDDQESFDRQVREHRVACDDLGMWLAHYSRPGVDPALVVEDVDNSAPAIEPEDQ